MSTNREEKEKHVLDLYHTKGYTYRKIAEELRMSPNQISDVIRKHEENDNAIGNKRSTCLCLPKLTHCFLK
jgi:transposase